MNSNGVMSIDGLKFGTMSRHTELFTTVCLIGIHSLQEMHCMCSRKKVRLRSKLSLCSISYMKVVQPCTNLTYSPLCKLYAVQWDTDWCTWRHSENLFPSKAYFDKKKLSKLTVVHTHTFQTQIQKHPSEHTGVFCCYAIRQLLTSGIVGAQTMRKKNTVLDFGSSLRLRGV